MGDVVVSRKGAPTGATNRVGRGPNLKLAVARAIKLVRVKLFG